MKNNKSIAMIRGLFGKALMAAFFLGVLSAASYAQTGKLYYQSGGAYYGKVTVFPGSFFQIDTNNSVIKTFANSCKPVSSGGVPGVLCTFGQFVNGQHKYSGYGYFFQNGIVYLKWTNENMGAYWRQIDTGWYGFRP